MSSFRDGHARICKRDFWPIIPLSFKQILNLCFNMADIYCTSKVFCLTFVTTATNFSHRRFWGLKFVWNYDKWPDLNWCTIIIYSWLISNYVLIYLVRILAHFVETIFRWRQWAEKMPEKGGALSIIAFNLEVLILGFTSSAVILKILMAEISLTALKKEWWSVMIVFHLITSVAAGCLIVAPILSTLPFVKDAKKIPCYFNTTFVLQSG